VNQALAAMQEARVILAECTDVRLLDLERLRRYRCGKAGGHATDCDRSWHGTRGHWKPLPTLI